MKISGTPSYTLAVRHQYPPTERGAPEFGEVAQSLANEIRGHVDRGVTGVMTWLESRHAYLRDGESPVTEKEFNAACCMNGQLSNPPLRTDFHLRIMDESDHGRAVAVLNEVRKIRKRV